MYICCVFLKINALKKEFEIKPFTADERRRIESGRDWSQLSILFFCLLSTVLISVFIYGIYKSLNEPLVIGMFIVSIIGICICLYFLIKSDISEIKKDNIILKRNEKYCNKGKINSKWFESRKLGVKNLITQFYVEIENVKYEISQKDYGGIESGNYVYYEVKHPLYTEVKKIN